MDTQKERTPFSRPVPLPIIPKTKNTSASLGSVLIATPAQVPAPPPINEHSLGFILEHDDNPRGGLRSTWFSDGALQQSYLFDAAIVLFCLFSSFSQYDSQPPTDTVSFNSIAHCQVRLGGIAQKPICIAVTR